MGLIYHPPKDERSYKELKKNFKKEINQGKYVPTTNIGYDNKNGSYRFTADSPATYQNKNIKPKKNRIISGIIFYLTAIILIACLVIYLKSIL